MFSGFKLKLAYQRINEDTIQYSTNGQHSLNDLEYSVAWPLYLHHQNAVRYSIEVQ